MFVFFLALTGRHTTNTLLLIKEQTYSVNHYFILSNNNCVLPEVNYQLVFVVLLVNYQTVFVLLVVSHQLVFVLLVVNYRLVFVLVVNHQLVIFLLMVN